MGRSRQADAAQLRLPHGDPRDSDRRSKPRWSALSHGRSLSFSVVLCRSLSLSVSVRLCLSLPLIGTGRTGVTNISPLSHVCHSHRLGDGSDVLTPLAGGTSPATGARARDLVRGMSTPAGYRCATHCSSTAVALLHTPDKSLRAGLQPPLPVQRAATAACSSARCRHG